MTSNSAPQSPPALPPRSNESKAKAEDDHGKLATFYVVVGAVASVVLGVALTSPRLFFGFLLGFASALLSVFGALYYFLNLAKQKALQDKHNEVQRKVDQPVMESKVRTQPPSAYLFVLALLSTKLTPIGFSHSFFLTYDDCLHTSLLMARV